jgi:hypothetical protein
MFGWYPDVAWGWFQKILKLLGRDVLMHLFEPNQNTKPKGGGLKNGNNKGKGSNERGPEKNPPNRRSGLNGRSPDPPSPPPEKHTGKSPELEIMEESPKLEKESDTQNDSRIPARPQQGIIGIWDMVRRYLVGNHKGSGDPV